MRSQKLDVNKDPMDPLEQVAILGNHPYLLRSLFFSMKSSFIVETTSISHISRQVSLESFTTCMSVVRMAVRISVVNDFEVPLTTLYDFVDTQENHIGSQGNTDTDTLGVAQQSELPQGHAQTAYRHPPSPSGPWNAVVTQICFSFESRSLIL